MHRCLNSTPCSDMRNRWFAQPPVEDERLCGWVYRIAIRRVEQDWCTSLRSWKMENIGVSGPVFLIEQNMCSSFVSRSWCANLHKAIGLSANLDERWMCWYFGTYSDEVHLSWLVYYLRPGKFCCSPQVASNLTRISQASINPTVWWKVMPQWSRQSFRVKKHWLRWMSCGELCWLHLFNPVINADGQRSDSFSVDPQFEDFPSWFSDWPWNHHDP